MTKQEIEKRLEENRKHQFMIQMVDRWTEKHYEAIKRLEEEEKKLEEILKNV